MAKNQTIGLNESKDGNLSEWYTQVVLKSRLADYSSVSGCIVYRELSYAIWERVMDVFNGMIKGSGHKNVYFPMLIPERLLLKEQEHVEGFSPEVAWVTHAGNSPLAERLAIRPTSETVIYDSYAKWIRSHRDLPLLLNQWCSVVRWEFKHPRPFLRGREFLWQEGHTVHASLQDANDEVYLIVEYYRELMEEYFAIPVMIGIKSPAEKFAGADVTVGLEAIMPDGKCLQMGTSHLLGTNFSVPFDITFTDKDGEVKHAFTTSWGVSTRMIGGMVLVHGDDHGLVVPPRLAPTQVVIVPITTDESKQEVISNAVSIRDELRVKGVRCEIDARDTYSPGWKFNEHELQGTPIRIEIGKRDIDAGTVMVYRRDSHVKQAYPREDLDATISAVLTDIQRSLFERAKKAHDARIVSCASVDAVKEAVDSGKIALAPFNFSEGSEAILNERTGGDVRVVSAQQPLQKGTCIVTGEPAQQVVLIGKSY